MPDFNKGDFTQQGVAGHVNANLRLNEKRLVNIDMTSNEEAEGCTIAGTVTDLLNDKVYNIGSAPSGNIEITENGENINVAPYATATVNVAGGDLPVGKCVVTIVNSAESTMNIDFTDSATPIYISAGYTALNNALIRSGDYLSEATPVITPGQSFEIIMYYDSLQPCSAGYTTSTGYDIQVSNIVNMAYDEELESYVTTDTTEDSAITLTVVHTIS